MTRSTEECDRVANELRGYALVMEHDTITLGMLDFAAVALRDVARERDAAIAAMVKEREAYLCMSEQIAQYETRYRALRAAHERLREALTEIARGTGPFSRDRLTHAENCIEAMKQLALDALAPGAGTGEK